MSPRLCFAGLALLTLLISAGFRAPSRQQELRVLITARNMIEAQDPLHFEFQNQPRYRKPPLPYWLSALGLKLGGQTQSAFWGRVVFVAATTAFLLLVYRLANPAAAWICLFSYGVWRYGVAAETDLLNVFGITLAFFGHTKDRGGLSGLGMAIGVLSKGPAGLLIPLLSFLVLQRRDPRSVRFWIAAVIPPLLAAAGWVGFLYMDPVAREALRVELSDTFLDSPHRKFPLYYVWIAPLVLFPGSLLLLRLRKSSTFPRLPLVWFGVTFVLLTLTVSKQNHYALLLLPPGAWLLSSLLPSTFRFPKTAMAGLASLWLAGEAYRYHFDENALHMRFLREATPQAAEAGTLHVVGINSAVFDFHLGRHVHNTDSATHALRRARPEDAVLLIQKRARVDMERLPSGIPVDTVTDSRGWTRFYLPPSVSR